MSLPAICTSVWQIPQNLTSKVTSSSPATFLSIEIFSNMESGLVFAQAIVLYIAVILSESFTCLPAVLPFIQNTYNIILILQLNKLLWPETKFNWRITVWPKAGAFWVTGYVPDNDQRHHSWDVSDPVLTPPWESRTLPCQPHRGGLKSRQVRPRKFQGMYAPRVRALLISPTFCEHHYGFL